MPVQTAIEYKLSIKELSALYDRIYDIADRLFKKHNPCKIYIEDKHIFCKYHQKGIPLANGYYLCCSSCIHCSKNGCSVKCLACKLHMCHCDTNLYVFAKRLDRLIKIACNYRLPVWGYYTSKEQWLKQIKGTGYGK